ncbi:hypothetical protein V8C86DRAFT_3128782 [Haematococcus lacustris]
MPYSRQGDAPSKKHYPSTRLIDRREAPGLLYFKRTQCGPAPPPAPPRPARPAPPRPAPPRPAPPRPARPPRPAPPRPAPPRPAPPRPAPPRPAPPRPAPPRPAPPRPAPPSAPPRPAPPRPAPPRPARPAPPRPRPAPPRPAPPRPAPPRPAPPRPAPPRPAPAPAPPRPAPPRPAPPRPAPPRPAPQPPRPAPAPPRPAPPRPAPPRPAPPRPAPPRPAPPRPAPPRPARPAPPRPAPPRPAPPRPAPPRPAPPRPPARPAPPRPAPPRPAPPRPAPPRPAPPRPAPPRPAPPRPAPPRPAPPRPAPPRPAPPAPPRPAPPRPARPAPPRPAPPRPAPPRPAPPRPAPPRPAPPPARRPAPPRPAPPRPARRPAPPRPAPPRPRPAPPRPAPPRPAPPRPAPPRPAPPRPAPPRPAPLSPAQPAKQPLPARTKIAYIRGISNACLEVVEEEEVEVYTGAGGVGCVGAGTTPLAHHTSLAAPLSMDQVMLSYRVPETGAVQLGGDGCVLRLRTALERIGFSVFVGEEGIDGGQSWAAQIQAAVLACDVFVPLCSRTYGATKWTRRELHLADAEDRPIIPVWHSGDYPPKELAIYLSGVQRVPKGAQPLLLAEFNAVVAELVACIQLAGCKPKNMMNRSLTKRLESSRQPAAAPQSPRTTPGSPCSPVAAPPAAPAWPAPRLLGSQLLLGGPEGPEGPDGMRRTASAPDAGAKALSWDSVACSAAGKAALQAGLVNPHTAALLVRALGYDRPLDLQGYSHSQLLSLGLSPVELHRLTRLVANAQVGFEPGTCAGLSPAGALMSMSPSRPSSGAARVSPLGSGPRRGPALGAKDAVPSPLAPRTPQAGGLGVRCYVRAAEGCLRGGPLGPGLYGMVVEEDGSDGTFRVRVIPTDEVAWYASSDLQPASVEQAQLSLPHGLIQVGCQVRVLEAGLSQWDVEEGPLGRGVQGLVVRDDLSGHRPWTVEAIGTRELWSYASAVLQVVPVSSAVTPGAHTSATTGPITASFSATLRHADIAVDGHCARKERGSSEFSADRNDRVYYKSSGLLRTLDIKVSSLAAQPQPGDTLHMVLEAGAVHWTCNGVAQGGRDLGQVLGPGLGAWVPYVSLSGPSARVTLVHLTLPPSGRQELVQPLPLRPGQARGHVGRRSRAAWQEEGEGEERDEGEGEGDQVGTPSPPPPMFVSQGGEVPATSHAAAPAPMAAGASKLGQEGPPACPLVVESASQLAHCSLGKLPVRRHVVAARNAPLVQVAHEESRAALRADLAEGVYVIAAASAPQTAPLMPGKVALIVKVETGTAPYRVRVLGTDAVWRYSGAELEPITPAQAMRMQGGNLVQVGASVVAAAAWSGWGGAGDAGQGPLAQGLGVRGRVVKDDGSGSKPWKVKVGGTEWWYASSALCLARCRPPLPPAQAGLSPGTWVRASPCGPDHGPLARAGCLASYALVVATDCSDIAVQLV